MKAEAPRFKSAIPLVESKFQPPFQRPAMVERPRLVDLLVDTSGPPVVAVIAPPGYGKTTLLAQWAVRETRPVAWLTIDDRDNDPAVLLSYLATALDRIAPIDDAIAAGIRAPRERILATVVPHLMSAIHRWERPAVIVLDDAHRLVDRTSLDALAQLLDHLPRRFRVAIGGRSEPDLPFARLRSTGSLAEIGTEQLALVERETAAVVAADHHPLSPEAVRLVHARTEGWAAGVHLAVMALADGDDGSATLAALSGRDRYIAAYLRFELQRSLGPDDVMVLTRTSILETITPEVAEAVTGVAGAWERLTAIARENLLIHEIGPAGQAYRYHNLLRDFLQGELNEREPGIRSELHARAAACYTAAGDLDSAVAQAIASGDVDGAARLVTAVAVPLFYAGHGRSIDRWLQSFAHATYVRHPPLAVIAAWIYLLNGRPEAADVMAAIADRSTFDGPPGDGSADFESQRAMLRAVMSRSGPKDMLANAELAVAREHPESPWRANALYLLGAARLMLSDVDGADVALEASTRAGPPSSSSVARAKRASIAMMRQDWTAAERLARESLNVLIEAHYEEIGASLITYAVAARVAIQRGDRAKGREHLVSAQLVRPLVNHAFPCYSVDALLELARAHLATGDTSGAQVVVREAEAIVRRRPGLGVLTTELVALRRQLADAATTLAGSTSLTAAELRLLPLLPTYLSFQEIADRLYVSRNTVKTQAMTIYGKLQASSRGEAVERAVELGLLEPYPGLVPGRRQAPG